MGSVEDELDVVPSCPVILHQTFTFEKHQVKSSRSELLLSVHPYVVHQPCREILTPAPASRLVVHLRAMTMIDVGYADGLLPQPATHRQSDDLEGTQQRRE